MLKCQFLLGKVLPFEKSFMQFAKKPKCQFLLGKVLRSKYE